MATWHQQQARNRGAIRLDHPTQWTVVIDPPGEFCSCYCTSTKQLAEVYLRNLKENNPGAHRHAYTLPPRNKA